MGTTKKKTVRRKLKKAKAVVSRHKSTKVRRRPLGIKFKIPKRWLEWAGFTAVPVVAVAIVGVVWQVYSPRTANNAVIQAVTRAGPLAHEFAEASRLADTGARIAYWSDKIIKDRALTVKLRSLENPPLIEDSAPLVPYKYDCTTFVETVSALVRSAKPADFYKNLLAIRYADGKYNYTDRNHFPEADWLPNNIRSGLVRDVSGEVARAGGFDASTVTKTINRGQWLARQTRNGKISRALASAATSTDWSAPVRAGVTYIPREKIGAVIDAIPGGTIMNIVRSDNPKKPVLITHQGFVVKNAGKTYFRHAMPDGRMRTVALEGYLKSVRSTGAWPVIGVNLVRLN